MTPTNQNVETLQTEVNQVSADLVEAKKQTDETLKKTKAEAAELRAETTLDKVKTAKEETNKKLKALEGKTDAISKAEIIKLQSEIDTYEDMLKVLDSSKIELATLKAGVTTPEVEKTSIDNTADMTNITTGIAEMKTMVTELQTIIDEYNKTKSTLSETEKTIKEKDIADKKASIENKRKEIQAIIDKIKKVWTDFKFDDIPDETMKAALKTQKETELKNLDDYKKQLNAVATPTLTFGEKITNVANKTWERAKENPWKTGSIVVGAGLLIGWMAGWFKKKKKSEGDDKDKDGKKEKSRFGKNRRKLGLGGLGIRGIYKLFFGKKNPEDKDRGDGTEIPGTLRSVENAVKSFEDIKDPTTKANLNTVGTSVNTFFDSVDKFNDGTVPTSIDSPKLGDVNLDKYAGVIPHIIDNSYTDIGHFTSESGLAWLSIDATVDDITKTFADMISKGLESVVSFVLGTAGFSGKNISMDKVKTFLTGKNSKEKTIKIRQEIYKTFSYAKFAENAYISKTVYDYSKAGNILYKRTNADATREAVTINNPDDLLDGKLMEKMQLDPENYMINELTLEEIQADVRGKKLKDIPNLGVTQVDIEKFNTPLYTKLKEYNKERDNKGITVETDQKGTLEKMKEHVDSDLANSFWESARKSLPLLNLFGGDEDRAKKAFRSISGYQELLTKYQTKFEKLKTETDMTKVKAEIDNYYCTLKEIATMQFAIEKAVDENGHAGVSIIGRFTAFFEGCRNHIVLGWNERGEGGIGNILAGIYNIGIGVGSFAAVYYAIRHPMKTGRYVLKNIGNGIQTGASMFGRNIAYRDIMPDKWLVKYYEKNTKYLTYDYVTNRMSTSKADGVLKEMNKTNPNIFDYLKGQGVFGTSNHDEIATFLNKNRSFLENDEIKKALFFKDRKRSDRLKNRKNVKISLENNIYDELKTLRNNMDLLKPNQTKLCERIIEKARIDKKTNIITDFFAKMKEFTKSDALKNLDIEKFSINDVYNLAENIGKNMDNLSSADEINAYIKSLNSGVNTIPPETSDIFTLADETNAEAKIAEKLKTSRTVKGYPGELDTGGALDKPELAQFKQEYQDILNKKTPRTYQTYEDADKALAKKIFTDQDTYAKTILEETKTKQLADFTTKMESRISELNTKKGLFTNNDAPERLAKANIEKQVTSLKNIESTAATMTEDQLKGFETLYNNIKGIDGCMNDVTRTWEAATKDEKLMKALTEGDVAELEKFKGKVPEVENVIKLFDKEGKNVEKILAGGAKFDEVLESLLKAFMRFK